MNWEQIATYWSSVVAELQRKWAKLSDEDLAQLGEKRALLVSALERHYGIQKKHAELQIDRFVEKLKPPGSLPPDEATPAARGGK
jgi:hypothetical protein